MGRWSGIALIGIVALFAGTPSMAGEKSPVASGLLSGLVGLGAGHYYAGDVKQGAAFTLGELILYGGAAAASANDNSGLATGAMLALLGVRVYEIVDGVGAAGRYNKKHGYGKGFLDYDKPSFGMSFSSSVFGDYRSDGFANLWAEGGASRDMALAYKRTREFKSPWSLDLAVADLGVGCSWNGKF